VSVAGVRDRSDGEREHCRGRTEAVEREPEIIRQCHLSKTTVVLGANPPDSSKSGDRIIRRSERDRREGDMGKEGTESPRERA